MNTDGTVWDYNTERAVETARAGFDEMQFDYGRFSDDLEWPIRCRIQEKNVILTNH
jgi:hypothetical protein